jgi:hypothetical protein
MRWLMIVCASGGLALADASVPREREAIRSPRQTSRPRSPNLAWAEQCRVLLKQARDELALSLPQFRPTDVVEAFGGVEIISHERRGPKEQPMVWVTVDPVDVADSPWIETTHRVPPKVELALGFYEHANGRRGAIQLHRVDGEKLRPWVERLLKPAVDACLQM